MENLRHKNGKEYAQLVQKLCLPLSNFSPPSFFPTPLSPMVASASLFLQTEAKYVEESACGLLITITESQVQEKLLSILKESLQFSFKREDCLEVRTVRTV